MVIAPNFPLPSPSKSKVTYQPDAPCGSSSALALVTCRPRTSAGAKMYLRFPLRSQLTTATASLLLDPPCLFCGRVQSSAAYCAFNSGVTPDGNIAVAVSVVKEVAFAAPSAKTGRNLNSAVCPTKSTILRPVSPGTAMTIWRLTPVP